MARTARHSLLAAWLALLCACATPPARDGGVTPLPAVTSPGGALIARAALDLLGTPYRYGGNAPGGFDCSGLVQYTHAQAGIALPRTTREQFATQKREPVTLEAGDVLFFRIRGRIAHNGIYVGDGRFVHAPSKGKNVMLSRTDNPYFRQRLAGIRRFHSRPAEGIAAGSRSYGDSNNPP